MWLDYLLESGHSFCGSAITKLCQPYLTEKLLIPNQTNLLIEQ